MSQIRITGDRSGQYEIGQPCRLYRAGNVYDVPSRYMPPDLAEELVRDGFGVMIQGALNSKSPETKVVGPDIRKEDARGAYEPGAADAPVRSEDAEEPE